MKNIHATVALTIMLTACANESVRHQATVGLPNSKVVTLMAASAEANFTCAIRSVDDATGSPVVPFNLALKKDVTLLPGTYQVNMQCTNGVATAYPSPVLGVEPGYTYRLVGYISDRMNINGLLIGGTKISIRVDKI